MTWTGGLPAVVTVAVVVVVPLLEPAIWNVPLLVTSLLNTIVVPLDPDPEVMLTVLLAGTVNALVMGRTIEVFSRRSRRRATRNSFAGYSYPDDLIGKNHTTTKFSISAQFVVSYENLVFVSRRLSYGWFSQGRSAQMPSAELAFG